MNDHYSDAGLLVTSSELMRLFSRGKLHQRATHLEANCVVLLAKGYSKKLISLTRSEAVENSNE